MVNSRVYYLTAEWGFSHPEFSFELICFFWQALHIQSATRETSVMVLGNAPKVLQKQNCPESMFWLIQN